MKEKERREYSLDILKILATIMIVFHHYQQGEGVSFSHFNFYGGKFYFGWLVELFFILSGYFMFRYVEKIRNGLSFRRFFLKRYLRVLPIMFLSAIGHQIIKCWYQKATTGSVEHDLFSLWKTVISAFGIQRGWVFQNKLDINNPAWYISVLLACYLYFFFVTYLSGRTRTSPWIWYGGLVLVGIWAYLNKPSLPLLNQYTGRGIQSFFWGLILAKGIGLLREKGARGLWCGIYVWVFLALVAIPVLIYRESAFVSDNVNYLMIFICYPALMILFTSGFMKKLFSARWIGSLAAISFNVYIWHVCGRLLMDILIAWDILIVDVKSPVTMIVYTLCMFVIGTGSYYLIEKPVANALSKAGICQEVQNGPES